jgi:hypothetical protein
LGKVRFFVVDILLTGFAGIVAATEKFAHELKTGDEYEPLVVVIDPQLNQQILFAQEEFSPRYVEPRNSRPPLVNPALLLQLSANTKSPSFRLAKGTGSILSEATVSFLNPAYVGRRLRVSWRVVSEYEKRGRSYYVMEAMMHDDDDGRAVLRRELHLTFFHS